MSASVRASQRDRLHTVLLLAPAAALLVVAFIAPMVRLVLVGASGPEGWAMYGAVLSEPRYWRSTFATLMLAATVTLATLVISGVVGVFLAQQRFVGRRALVAMLTLPLAFPGVVIGFMVIMLGGRQGLLAQLSEWLTGERIVWAYSMFGLFVGYVYFSIPRTVLTVMAAAEKLDPALMEAARSLGANPWHTLRDVLLPALKPALAAAGAICFATAMGAFGTAFTLATKINVLPMVIYTEFTLQANVAAAAALSLLLGGLTWAALAWARNISGNNAASAA